MNLLDAGAVQAGAHQLPWAGSDGSGHQVPAGAYYVRLESTVGIRSQKITLVR